MLDLARAAVFVDFDGTATLRDTGVHLLERLAGPEWAELDERYAAGLIGSRECVTRQWDMLPADEALLRSVAAEVPLDPDLEPLVRALKGAGAEVTVVSDGFGFRAEEVGEALGVTVLTNRVDWATGRLEFPHLDRCCPCSSCGTCKQAPIRDARRRGLATVFIGDGVSDRKAALLADVLFAKSGLADWCDEVGVDYRAYHRLADVRRALGL